ncbi:MAG: hypothetical protein AAFQ79_18185 [Pseudomonadota bacterium]
MNKAKIFAPAAGTAVSLAAALDVYWGGGAVDWLVDLCLSDPDAPPMAMDLPMRPHTGVLPFLASATACASIACVMARQSLTEPPKGTPFTEVQFRVLAVLSILADTSERLGPRDVTVAYRRLMWQPLSIADAQTASEVFTYAELDDDIDLFADVTDPGDRRMIICAAIDFARRAGATEAMIEVIDAVACAMAMDATEIASHWADQDDAQTTEDGEVARAPFGAGLATTTANLRRQLGPGPFAQPLGASA